MNVRCVTPLGEEVGSISYSFSRVLESVPEAHSTAEQDRDHHDMHVVDQPGGKEVADHRGASAESYVLAAAASRAASSASAGEASMKWYVVPPSISIDGSG